MRHARKPNIGACMLDRSRACATCARLSHFFFGQGSTCVLHVYVEVAMVGQRPASLGCTPWFRSNVCLRDFATPRGCPFASQSASPAPRRQKHPQTYFSRTTAQSLRHFGYLEGVLLFFLDVSFFPNNGFEWTLLYHITNLCQHGEARGRFRPFVGSCPWLEQTFAGCTGIVTESAW